MKLRFALQNAKVYGVEDRINFICGDFFSISKNFIAPLNQPIDAVFLSPPWGGPSYLKKNEFKLDKMTPNGFEIFKVAKQISQNIAYFLPKNTDFQQVTMTFLTIIIMLQHFS